MSGEKVTIDTLLRTACESKASDLHLKVGNYPYLRVDGELRALTQYSRISPEDMLDFAFSIMTNRQKQKFKENTELDMPYAIPGLSRFRLNVFQQRGNVGMVFRVIPSKIQTFEELSLPKVMETICQETRGLVVLAGTTSWASPLPWRQWWTTSTPLAPTTSSPSKTPSSSCTATRKAL
jgi:twitching motility protein PilT